MGKIVRKDSMPDSGAKKWLLLFYTVPSKPVNARVKIWRRLAKAGAVQFKSAVYILPNNEENYELCQWLVSEAASMKGEGAFVSVDRIEAIRDQEIIGFFNSQREKDYGAVEKKLEEIERKTSSAKKGSGIHNNKKLSEQFSRLEKEFEDIRKVDFFTSTAGMGLKKKFEALRADIKRISKSKVRHIPEVVLRTIDNYQGRTWVTRKRPFVDRMASAWLIRKFIDKKAVFRFADEKDMETLEGSAIAFDVRGGEFTHQADLCTFEVFIKTFTIKDKALIKIAELVHELDIKDEKYKNPEAKGVEDILAGIRKTAKSDMECLEKGMTVFEMLYASKNGGYK